MKVKERNRIKPAKVCISLVMVLILGIGVIFVINEYVKSSVKNRIISAEEASKLDADCILILGAGVWAGGRPSYMLEDRLIQGIDLYKDGASQRLLMSGDHSKKDYDEVNVMKQFAIDKDVPSESVFMDHAGFSTYESIYRARDIFQANKVIIVTQKYHIYRALYIADQLGVEAYGVNADPRSYNGQVYREFREILARVKDFFYVIFQPEPTFLGETIPITGNGDVTND